jgi:hypothetical protein
MLNDLDNALIEARRLNEKLQKFRIDGGKNYEQNSFAKYLSAILWEADGKWDDAFIAYKETYDLDPYFPGLKIALLKAAKKAQRLDAYQDLKSQFKIQDIAKESPNSGELIAIVQQGWGPRKYPDPNSPRFPTLRPVYSYAVGAQLNIEGRDPIQIPLAYSIQDVAVKTFTEDYGSLVGGRVAGLVAKEIFADQIRQKNEDLGNLIWFILQISDRADLRQWSTLPQNFLILRESMPAGKYNVSLQGIDRYGATTSDSLLNQQVEIKNGHKSFMIWRMLR